jgi:hypothetical protein
MPRSAGSDREDFLERYRARTEAQNAAARATLEPLAPGERPWPLRVAVAVATVAGVANLVLFAAGATIDGKQPAAGPILVFSALMLACAFGMWRRVPAAVLGFMALLAIVVILFSLFLVEASNLLGFLVPPLFICGGGYLFWKLVRVLGRLQAPPPGAPDS